MTQSEQHSSGDYGYDLAHDFPTSVPAPRRRERPATSLPPRPERDLGSDSSYDEAHDF